MIKSINAPRRAKYLYLYKRAKKNWCCDQILIESTYHRKNSAWILSLYKRIIRAKKLFCRHHTIKKQLEIFWITDNSKSRCFSFYFIRLTTRQEVQHDSDVAPVSSFLTYKTKFRANYRFSKVTSIAFSYSSSKLSHSEFICRERS